MLGIISLPLFLSKVINLPFLGSYSKQFLTSNIWESFCKKQPLPFEIVLISIAIKYFKYHSSKSGGFEKNNSTKTSYNKMQVLQVATKHKKYILGQVGKVENISVLSDNTDNN